MRLFFSMVFLSSSVLSACGTDGTPEQTAQDEGGASHQEEQLADVSAMLHEAMNIGDVIANPFDESGVNPYAFVSERARASFYQFLSEADLTVSVWFPTLNELSQSPAKVDDGKTGFATKSYCGPGYECSNAGFCEGGIVDCSYGYCNIPGYYGAYTTVDDYISGSMVPFSAEVSLPYYASAVGDYNYSYTSPRELYIDQVSTSSSADRSKHRCCYWFWGSPSWTIQCSQYFYNEL